MGGGDGWRACSTSHLLVTGKISVFKGETHKIYDSSEVQRTVSSIISVFS